MAGHRIEAVEAFTGFIRLLLERVRTTKGTFTFEPPLAKSDFPEQFALFHELPFGNRSLGKRISQYAVIETGSRLIFNELLASYAIDQAEFVSVWNLLDIISVLSEGEECDPALLFWLVEELLDSQTISGCSMIFDYLESRRELITAKHFASKKLVILRSCNELLRRLSRAEDTAFCGRVFIFMFQSFPLGDKSSVNLRGEYHTENVTTFEEIESNLANRPYTIEVDSVGTEALIRSGPDEKLIVGVTMGSSGKNAEEIKSNPKSVTFDQSKAGVEPSIDKERPLDPDSLYPIFWSLQQSFSQPKILFDSEHFSTFKQGINATLANFTSMTGEQNGRGSLKSGVIAEDGKRALKRKREQDSDGLANAFNPKYLTSRDLFELEISDLSFRRHILVQTLILMDFLLSLSAKAQGKAATVANPNRSVMYQDQILGDEDIKWVIQTKKIIAEYLKQGSEGPFFHRMVETVLSRDKNWVRWKTDNCPPISRPAVSPDDYIGAKNVAKRATATRRLRTQPMGSLELHFLAETGGIGRLKRLKDPTKYQIPSFKSFERPIADDEFEIEMPSSDNSKEAAVTGKASKSWRALRIASKTRLEAFDRIDDDEKISVIFQSNSGSEARESGQDPLFQSNMEVAGLDILQNKGDPILRDEAKVMESRREDGPMVILEKVAQRSHINGVGTVSKLDLNIPAHVASSE